MLKLHNWRERDIHFQNLVVQREWNSGFNFHMCNFEKVRSQADCFLPTHSNTRPRGERGREGKEDWEMSLLEFVVTSLKFAFTLALHYSTFSSFLPLPPTPQGLSLWHDSPGNNLGGRKGCVKWEIKPSVKMNLSNV